MCAEARLRSPALSSSPWICQMASPLGRLEKEVVLKIAQFVPGLVEEMTAICWLLVRS
jgi:hypothetical protein